MATRCTSCTVAVSGAATQIASSRQARPAGWARGRSSPRPSGRAAAAGFGGGEHVRAAAAGGQQQTARRRARPCAAHLPGEDLPRRRSRCRWRSRRTSRRAARSRSSGGRSSPVAADEFGGEVLGLRRAAAVAGGQQPAAASSGAASCRPTPRGPAALEAAAAPHQDRRQCRCGSKARQRVRSQPAPGGTRPPATRSGGSARSSGRPRLRRLLAVAAGRPPRSAAATRSQEYRAAGPGARPRCRSSRRDPGRPAAGRSAPAERGRIARRGPAGRCPVHDGVRVAAHRAWRPPARRRPWPPAARCRTARTTACADQTSAERISAGHVRPGDAAEKPDPVATPRSRASRAQPGRLRVAGQPVRSRAAGRRRVRRPGSRAGPAMTVVDALARHQPADASSSRGRRCRAACRARRGEDARCRRRTAPRRSARRDAEPGQFARPRRGRWR